MIRRFYEDKLMTYMKPGKVLLILGARRVGKTQLLKKLTNEIGEPYIFLNGDDIETSNLLEPRSISNYERLLGDKKMLIIDEAQEIPDIGRKLKLMVDTIEDLKILITGSSAFEINSQIGEPLTGRMKTLHLYPIAQLEFAFHETYIETKKNLEERLIFGSYPELTTINDINDKISYLRELVNNHLLRDIFAYESIKKRDKITALLQKLAFRTGSEISIEALGREIGVSKNTVDKYLDLFSKVFIMYSVSGLSRNRDNEITKMKKWYFVDNGIRNALINSFNKLNMREDTGQLWENYINSERRKYMEYKRILALEYFWRTHSRQEIDRIEERNGEINAFEYKWGTKPVKVPGEFKNAYPDAKFHVINPNNYLDFIAKA
jgi:uncharacterized protein